MILFESNFVSLHRDNVHDWNNEIENDKNLHLKTGFSFFMNTNSTKHTPSLRYLSSSDLIIPFSLLLVKYVNAVEAYWMIFASSAKSQENTLRTINGNIQHDAPHVEWQTKIARICECERFEIECKQTTVIDIGTGRGWKWRFMRDEACSVIGVIFIVGKYPRWCANNVGRKGSVAHCSQNLLPISATFTIRGETQNRTGWDWAIGHEQIISTKAVDFISLIVEPEGLTIVPWRPLCANQGKALVGPVLWKIDTDGRIFGEIGISPRWFMILGEAWFGRTLKIYFLIRKGDLPTINVQPISGDHRYSRDLARGKVQPQVQESHTRMPAPAPECSFTPAEWEVY